MTARAPGRTGAAAVVLAIALIVIAALSAGGGGGTRMPGKARTRSAKSPTRSAKAPPQSARVAAMFRGIPQRGQTLGDPHAPFTLLEFADLKCPICRAYSLNVLPTLLRRYVRPGKLKIVFQPQAFVGAPPGDSARGARFALAAGTQNRLWQFAELWYLNQRSEGVAYATDAYVRWIASGVRSLNVDRALAMRRSPQVTRELDDASGLFHTGGFAGTPGFALGPTGQAVRVLPATTSPQQFTGPIDRLLKRGSA